MDGLYAEAGVKKKDTIGLIALRVLLIVLAVLLFFAAFLITWMMILAAALICLDFLILPLLSVEYEYIFCDGQIDFDRINGGRRRKHILRIDMEEVELVAIQNSHALDNYQNISGKGSVYDFSSHQQNSRVYVAVTRSNGTVVKVLFEPSDKMLECIKQKSPRKLVNV